MQFPSAHRANPDGSQKPVPGEEGFPTQTCVQGVHAGVHAADATANAELLSAKTPVINVNNKTETALNLFIATPLNSVPLMTTVTLHHE